MSIMPDRQTSGIRDPYRSLLILLGGLLVALIILAGQSGFRDDLTTSNAQNVPSGRTAERQVSM